MKKVILLLFFLFSLTIYSQSKSNKRIFYTFSINGTIAQNTNYGEYDYYTGERDKNIFALGAVFLRNGLDIKINNRLITGFKFGLDYHNSSQVLAIPYYIDTKIIISELDDDRFYISGGIGRLFKMSKAFEKGSYFKLGVGFNIASEKKHSYIVSLDFHQKNITNFEKGKLNSLSIGLGMLFL